MRFIRQLIPKLLFFFFFWKSQTLKAGEAQHQQYAWSGLCAGRLAVRQTGRQTLTGLNGCEGFTAAWVRLREEGGGRCAVVQPHAARPDKSRSPHVSGYYRRPISPLLLFWDLLGVPINLRPYRRSRPNTRRAKETVNSRTIELNWKPGSRFIWVSRLIVYIERRVLRACCKWVGMNPRSNCRLKPKADRDPELTAHSDSRCKVFSFGEGPRRWKQTHCILLLNSETCGNSFCMSKLY